MAGEKKTDAPEHIPLPPSEHARTPLIAGGALALTAIMSTGPEAAQRIIDAQRAKAAPDALVITRAEAELFREALYHLPGFVDDAEQRTMLTKLRVFLDREVTS